MKKLNSRIFLFVFTFNQIRRECVCDVNSRLFTHQFYVYFLLILFDSIWFVKLLSIVSFAHCIDTQSNIDLNISSLVRFSLFSFTVSRHTRLVNIYNSDRFERCFNLAFYRESYSKYERLQNCLRVAFSLLFVFFFIRSLLNSKQY